MNVIKMKWVWKDETTLMRVHKVPRRKMFTPKEADFLPCKLRRFRDETGNQPSVSVKWEIDPRLMEIGGE